MATIDTLPEKLSYNHPLFFTTNDNSGAVLISLQLRGTENYSVWSRAMRIAILGRNKLGFIEGACKIEDYGQNQVDMWERCNTIVLSWLMNCVSAELLSEIVYSSNACALWNELKERFDKVDCTRIFQIHKQIATINQGTCSVAIYFSKLKLLWTEFDCFAPIPGYDWAKSREFIVFMERLKLLQFLMGLNELYEQAHNQILMIVPAPTLNKAYSMLTERESQRSMIVAYVSTEGA
ncbi:uncharacterized protein [Nicotiana tomentosiformis]|uniref:uncharacterized protein n=1 Tax=Nicotiana tomentosiformis TaxID=4098 RepID=UPI00388CCBD0